MDNLAIYTIRPVIPEYLDILLILKRLVTLGDDGVLPAETLREDKVHDGAVLLLDIITKLVVAAEVRGDALEEVGAVRPDLGEDRGPGFDFVVGVGGGDYGEIFWVEVEEVGGAGLGAEVGGDVYVPVGDVFFIFAGLFF